MKISKMICPNKNTCPEKCGAKKRHPKDKDCAKNPTCPCPACVPVGEPT